MLCDGCLIVSSWLCWCGWERLSVGVGNKLGLGCAGLVFVIVVWWWMGLEVRAGWETVVK